MPKRILSISYDESLLTTRHMILQEAGFRVTSVLGFLDAIGACEKEPFDLIIVGHSIPGSDKKALLEKLKETCPQSPVLGLRRVGQPAMEGMDCTIEAEEGPATLIAMVQKAVEEKSKPARPKSIQQK